MPIKANEIQAWEVPADLLSRTRRTETGCLEWEGYVDPETGYGVVYVGPSGFRMKRRSKAHRASYALAHGTTPEDILVLHRCNNRLCISPEHLYLGDVVQNQLDKVASGYGPNQHARKTQCTNGHEFTPENTKIDPVTGERICKACKRETTQRYRERVAAGQPVQPRDPSTPRQRHTPPQTHCHRGHEFTPENTRVRRGRRECRTCAREAMQAKRAAARATFPTPP